jgi:NADPH2:quinone reductase
MPKAVRIHAPGGPDALVYEDVEIGTPGPGEALIRQTAIGVNFIDVYHRAGAYPLAMPHGIGMEAAGVVEAVGEGVTEVAVGDRVAYAAGPPGSYAERRVHRAAALVKPPASIPDEIAASIMLQGMTTRYLLKQTYPVKAGDFVLVQAAAGGTGLMLCQWARHLGARVIGTVSTDDKAKLAAAHGCEFPIVYSREDFVARVTEITGGKGVAVVYDGVGKDTFSKSLECLAIRGYMVNFGSASGTPDPVAIQALAAKSLFLTRPTLFQYTASRDDLVENASDVFAAIGAGALTIETPRRYALKDAAQAHRDLEGRKTTGSIILVP